ncbi:MAG: flagellar basal body P-ring protein FlgI [Gemmataceae bacterium]|nr:flagellar basal body P-ring protein FlgI [Gemmataceae bacterium]
MKRIIFCLLLGIPLAVSGCLSLDMFSNPTVVNRSKSEDSSEEGLAKTVRDYAVLDNVQGIPVGGIGLVVGLDGTGGPAPQDMKEIVKNRLARDRIEDIGKLLNSPDTAIVYVSAVIKPGQRKGQFTDVRVEIPPGSKAKSLRGGTLLPTPLSTVASLGDIRSSLQEQMPLKPTDRNQNTMYKGHDLAVASGPLHLALTNDISSGREAGVEDAWVKTAYIWKGAKLLENRLVFLVLKSDEQRYSVATTLADRINQSFVGADSPDKIAEAKHKDLIAVSVPPRYRLNLNHFLRVLLAVPIDKPFNDPAYLRKLEEMLNDPAQAPSAALRLEALGPPAVPILKRGLKCDAPLSRFCAAESLAYLGHSAAAKPLGEIVVRHPSLQAYSLTALSALNEGASIDRLESLLEDSRPEVRYGAFRALREIDPTYEPIVGKWVGRAFVIHELAPKSENRMVHLLRGGRAEVTIFGDTVSLQPPFAIRVGKDITIRADVGDSEVIISRFPGTSPDGIHAKARYEVASILMTLGKLGASYTEVAEFLGKAEKQKALRAKLCVDAIPKGVELEKLATAARTDPKLENEQELLEELESDSDSSTKRWDEK